MKRPKRDFISWDLLQTLQTTWNFPTQVHYVSQKNMTQLLVPKYPLFEKKFVGLDCGSEQALLMIRKYMIESQLVPKGLRWEDQPLQAHINQPKNCMLPSSDETSHTYFCGCCQFLGALFM